ncbi:hypothetical protein CXP47_03185 [Pseudomonas chlororaphis]|nr:hypothetical protein CXP47_03185 [Pseudomonas chlororaphis]PWY40319.1 hypothetical protein DK261_17605 [Pseudomonas sp. RW409]
MLHGTFYGSCARDTFGCAGFLIGCTRSANPRTAATLLFSRSGWLFFSNLWRYTRDGFHPPTKQSHPHPDFPS